MTSCKPEDGHWQHSFPNHITITFTALHHFKDVHTQIFRNWNASIAYFIKLCPANMKINCLKTEKAFLGCKPDGKCWISVLLSLPLVSIYLSPANYFCDSTTGFGEHVIAYMTLERYILIIEYVIWLWIWTSVKNVRFKKLGTFYSYCCTFQCFSYF